MLIIVCGLQGSGKTIVARRISEKSDAVLLRTDVIRKELLQDITYNGTEMQNIYGEMFLRAEKLLQDGNNVVLDATFTKESNRMSAKNLAEKIKTGFKIVEVICDENVVGQRLKGRSGDESDAGLDVYLKYKSFYEPITGDHIVVDNSGTIEETEKQINVYF